MSAGVSTRMRAAASSIARGTPSSARQIPTTAARFASVSSNVGLAADARSDEQLDGGRGPRPCERVGRRGVVGRERLDVVDPLAAHAQHDAAGDEERGIAARPSTAARGSGAALDDLLEVVEHEQHPALVQRERRGAPRAAGRSVSRMPSAYPIVGRSSSGSSTFSSGTKTMPSGKSAPAASRDRDREPALADPAGTDERHQPRCRGRRASATMSATLSLAADDASCKGAGMRASRCVGGRRRPAARGTRRSARRAGSRGRPRPAPRARRRSRRRRTTAVSSARMRAISSREALVARRRTP